MVEEAHMPSIWLVPLVLVAAINLRLIVPGVMAFLGIWKPHLR
jgi:hypothetical protein